MTNYPKNLLAPIVDYLKKLEFDLLKRKKQLKSEDPFSDSARLNDNASDDTEAAEQFGHATSEALSAETEKALKKVRSAMQRVENGSYGKCVNCGKMIDTDRLGIDPTTDYCVECAKKFAPTT
jgi:RNA polymerase-binding transcription factor DksA